jgi:hypothetical protein
MTVRLSIFALKVKYMNLLGGELTAFIEIFKQNQGEPVKSNELFYIDKATF